MFLIHVHVAVTCVAIDVAVLLMLSIDVLSKLFLLLKIFTEFVTMVTGTVIDIINSNLY